MTEISMGKGWTFFTNHAHVLLCLSQNCNARLRDVADRVGITERAVHKIVSDLEQEGIVVRTREGRRNRYQINTGMPMRHPMEAHCSIGQIIETILKPRKENVHNDKTK